MDFKDTQAEAEFRARARNWLEKTVPVIWPNGRPESLEERIPLAKRYQAAKAEAGFVALSWAKELGGQALPQIFEVIWREEEQSFNVDNGFFGIGLNISIQTVMHYASPEDRERYLQPALRGEEIWCQLFSEPAGGSDVAAARTRATRDGDEWIVNGQKTWTTGAHYSDFGILIARTDPSLPKHKGLTMFFVDMHAPGVSVKPIRQANGEAEFNDVFFDEVRVSDSQRLGEVNQGWKAVITTLMFERYGAGGGLDFIGWKELLKLAVRTKGEDGVEPASADSRIRQRIADAWLAEKGLWLNNARAVTRLSRGETPGPEYSIGKLVSAAQAQQISYLMFDLLGPEGVRVPEEEHGTPGLMRAWMWGAAMRIAGGSEEIMRNIISERVLGLPAAARVDKDLPFNQLPA